MESTVKFTSRASIKIKDNFYTFEASVERKFNDSEEFYDEFKKDLWDEVNSEVDNQIIETRDFILSKN